MILRADNPNRRMRGLWVAFYGPDGVGKSAVIERLQREALEEDFGGSMRFHFRPRVGLPTRQRPVVTAPHAQVPRGWLTSTIKLLYWLLDCWLGYLLLVRPAKRRSRLVIFDRYLPDLLVDPLRYRLPQSVMKFAGALVRMAPRPDLCILLDAPAGQIQRRKQEVSLAESERQRTSYLQVFAQVPSTLVVDADRSIDEVTQTVATALSQMLQSSPPDSRRLSLCPPSI